MDVKKTALSDVLIVEPRIFQDCRGSFHETFQDDRYQKAGFPRFVQDNCSRSKRHVVRGLHYQLTHVQGKLVYVTYGHILDAAVDIRIGSPTFGQSIIIELSDENYRQVYIPPGFAHGFCVLSERADVTYKCTDFYDPSGERGIIWNDPDLNIQWPNEFSAIVSDKDLTFLRMKDIPRDQLPHYL